MRLILYSLFLITLVLIPAKSIAQGLPPIQKLMTPTEFEETGLSKLSDTEIKNLHIWLESFALRVYEMTSSQTSASNGDVIESQIVGTFNGWEGDTIFRLTNGQIWQQSSFAYRYHYAYRPGVTIFKTQAGYKMKVDGISESIYVKRIK